MNRLAKALMAAALACGAGQLIHTGEVHAQASSTAGALRGIIKDKATKEAAVGATVVATAPSLVGEQVVITDGDGQYFISSLPPGVYTLTIYYNDKPFSRGNVLIQVGKEAVVNVTVDSAAAGKSGGETIVIQGSAPIIDQGSTKTGQTITDDYTRNIPTGRTFGQVLGSAAGSQNDNYGTSIGGATSSENVFVVEGINTTDTGFGGISSNLPNEFIQETEVISGGYNAEFGRATGGIVNVVTKQGSNELRGSVYGYFKPGALYSAAERIQREGSSIDFADNVAYQYDFGAEVGGPIIKDKLWFHVGFNPSLSGNTRTRSIQQQVDKDGNGKPDRDPNGLTIREQVSERDVSTDLQQYFYTAKINGAINQNNQFQISAFGSPRFGDSPVSVTRNPSYQTFNRKDGAYDLAGKFTSKLNDGKTQIDAVIGFHRQIDKQTVSDDSQNVPTAEYNYTRTLYDFASLEGAGNIAACDDTSSADMYPLIQNCPVFRYRSQGIGVFEKRTNDRLSGVLAVTQRVKAAGYHTFKAGIDAEQATYDSDKSFTGGAFMRRSANPAPGQAGRWQVQQYLHINRNLSSSELADPTTVMLMENEFLCANDRAVCQVTANGYSADTTNINYAAFLQDSWQIRPNLTLNLGLRWENQTGYVADALKGTVSSEGEIIPDTAYELSNMVAPRVGFIYDPTSEGKSKIFGHWGQFYEAVPMDLNVRAFGGEINRFSNFNQNRRLPDAQGYDPNCDVDYTPGDTSDLSKQLLQCTDRVTSFTLGENPEFVTPGLKGQYTQELILGAEYEFVPDLKFGINYIHRTLPTVIEDVSTDGGNSYLITNPGNDFSGEADKLRAKAAQLMMTGDIQDMALAEAYTKRADNMDFIGTFDKPVRDYDAMQLTATQRPTKKSLLVASYTYSVQKANYSGLFSTETNQLDPNLTSLYDLPDLMANRYGNSGLDRPHNFKLDGFYQFDLKKAGILTAGASFRAQSGLAHNALAAHNIYGVDESYVLPRGAIPRSPVTTNTDVHFSYGYRLSKNMVAEGFIRIFNLFNQQEELSVDETFTTDNAMPVVGGTLSDLDHLKTIDPATQLEANKTATKNKNFGNLETRQLPRNIQLGFRVTF